MGLWKKSRRQHMVQPHDVLPNLLKTVLENIGESIGVKASDKAGENEKVAE